MNQLCDRPIVPKCGHVRSRKLLDSSRGQPCTLGFPGCYGGGETTVAAHANMQLCGKGTGIKASDIYSVDSCGSCHDVLDGRTLRNILPEAREAYFWRAFVRTTNRRLAEGLIKVEGAK